MTVPIQFITDMGVGTSVENHLKELRYNVISIRDLRRTMADEEILQIAKESNSVVITLDKDFGELVYKQGKGHTGVILLRIENADPAERIQTIDFILENFSNEIIGRFSVFKKGRLRISL